MSELLEVTLDEQGRITIPERIRARLGLLPGMTVLLEAEEDVLHLHPGDRTAHLIEKDGILVATGELEADPTDLIPRLRERRAAYILRLKDRASSL